ncbi:helix-turn-helix domain-containing protein [Actinacidiphila sp. ITFR-21]|uniref:helix-turn-helix domain-containing protein n=1 Tax=Actinacidiphila sp. ITFR-21 TaxID=3075199 RepID=UPI00288A8B4B|nr:helix-turn-helix transcriptional regulator [Streptomyces sp. ITFR-21]WNI19117.1 helix-turn-helix transcriptional regulator [Streptomyces sp. ITFR-21]
MMSRMGTEWAGVARAIRAERARKGMTQKSLATLAGVSVSTIQNLENVEKTYDLRGPDKIRQVEAALWEPGSVSAILSGGEPTPKLADPTAAPNEEPTDLSHVPLRVRHELQYSEIDDHDIIDLSDSGMRMVLVITHSPGADSPTQDQIKRGLRKWSALQRKLRNITAHGESDSPSDF